MSTILIVYASLTGNTEDIAGLIAEGIRTEGSEAKLILADECRAEDLYLYDAFLLGAYTWGDGELPDEFLDFTDELEELALEGRRAAVFGSGDMSYRIYCGAVDVLEEKLRQRGATIVQDSLKIEYGPSREEQEQCREYGRKFVRHARPSSQS
ncbi:flavodoxin [Cohnella fermenti]|uniref:Flavodoxin n=1 Tax=Cohnella fermenti TaxID=2565925 RepID=A0A4S4C3B1_9BACL|nr:flavodoxin [Cohnella fermenti]THF81645.1 flavodoxin [Cohnella fermenti]